MWVRVTNGILIFSHGTGLPKSISESLMSLNFRTSQVKLVKKSTSKSGKTCVVTQQHGTCCSKAGVECWHEKKSRKIMVVPGETSYSSFCFSVSNTSKSHFLKHASLMPVFGIIQLAA